MNTFKAEITYKDPKFARQSISGTSIEDVEEKLLRFLQAKGVIWNNAEEGSIISRPSIDGLEYAHSEEFDVVIVDMTEEIQKQESLSALEAEEKQLLEDLKSTDYLVIKQMELGEEIPQEVKNKRAENRTRINQIRQEIEEL